MARMARLKFDGSDGWYHLHARISGCKGEYPLARPSCRRELIGLIRRYAEAYCCEVAAFCIMGNHYHLVIRFDKPRRLTHDELLRRASKLYPKSRDIIKAWPKEKWDRLRDRLFDVSEYMRNVQSAFSRWYNKTTQRRGRFWADRFKSVCLENAKAVLDCMLYVELNPVRAGLVSRPETYKGSSYYYRTARLDSWLIKLSDVTPPHTRQPNKDYRMRLYYRGNVPTKKNHAAISQRILDDEAARGFKQPGAYRKRLRYFADGLALGSEQFVLTQLRLMRQMGQYLRRQHPINHPQSPHLTVREQRSHAIAF